MRISRISVVASMAAASIGVAACGSSSSSSSSSGTASGGSSSGSGSVTVNGAGSTFAAPIYQQFSSSLGSQGLTLNYNAVGSGAGVTQLQAGTVDFAGSDPAMKDAEIKAAKGPVVHFPLAFGSITISYNLPGIKSGLKLDGAAIADIYLGKIKTWNDPAIASLNPGLKLPSTAITPVYRSDSSGTTSEYTAFLVAYSPTWKSQVGAGKAVKFPTGTGGKGNAGVAAAVKQTVGGVGYVELAYALQNNFTYAAVKNASGAYVLPTLASTSAAGTGITLPPDLRFSAINSKSAGAYPIAGQTFIIAYQDMCKAGLSQSVASGVKKMITYALGPQGQATVQKLYYAPLPTSIDQAATAKIATLTCNGAPLS
ncbi:MAG: phosphate ABC transporter substrate-binding protein PstS [Solirubrobacteraceae bacterium]